MQLPNQAPPVQRAAGRSGEAYEAKLFCERRSIQGSEVSALPLSDIANDPSILFEGGEFLGTDPIIVFDIERPIPPIEMCDVYCGPQMCDVYCIDAEERIIHGHIYADIKTQTMQDDRTSGMEARVIHGHIYGDVEKE
jgi:hypothetical protein